MLHRVLASSLCVLGAVALGTGVASATLWRASDTLEASATGAAGTTLLLTEPGVLDLAADEVTVTASAEGRVVLALGRTEDVEAWVGTDAVTRVTGLTDRSTLSTEDVAAESPAPAEGEEAAAPAEGEEAAAPAEGEDAAPAEGEEAAVAAPDPAGSDLWVTEVVGEDGRATLEWPAEPGRWSVLVATDGGPATLTLVWPQVVTTPWLVPGVVLGAVLLLAGLVWWALLLVRARRAPVRRVTTGQVPVVPGAGTLGGAAAAATAGPPAAPRPGLATVPAALPFGGDPAAMPTAPGHAGGTSSPDGAAVPALEPGSGVTAPLTRRALRELEERERREARSRPRSGAQPVVAPAAPPVPGVPTVPTTTATVPGATGSPARPPARSEAPQGLAAPGARVGTAPTGAQAPTGAPARTGAQAPTAAAAPTGAPAPSGAPTPTGAPAPTGAPTAPGAPPPTSAAAPSAGVPASVAERVEGRRGVLGRFTGRRGGPAGPAAETPSETTPAPAGPPASDATGPAVAPSPSADAWRKAWGMPSTPARWDPEGAPSPAWPARPAAEGEPTADPGPTGPARPADPDEESR